MGEGPRLFILRPPPLTFKGLHTKGLSSCAMPRTAAPGLCRVCPCLSSGRGAVYGSVQLYPVYGIAGVLGVVPCNTRVPR